MYRGNMADEEAILILERLSGVLSLRIPRIHHEL